MAEHSGKDVLSSDVEIKGTIKFQKELLIDGKVEGEINSDGALTVGENADIDLRQGAGEHYRERALRIEVEMHASGRFKGRPPHH